MKHKYILPAILILVLISTFFIHQLTWLKFTDLTFNENLSDTGQKVKLPVDENGFQNKTLIIKGNINYRFFYQKTVKIIPDDEIIEIIVNDNTVDLNGISKNNKKNWVSGFDIHLKQHLNTGNNSIIIKLQNNGGGFGLQILPSLFDIRYLILVLIRIIIIFYLISLILSLFKFNIYLKIMILASLFIQLIYLNNTDFTVRSHDIFGHIDYIVYIMKNFKLPAEKQCWQCYQPPLYYIISAFVYGFSTLFNAGKYYSFKILQLLSVIYSTGFIITGIFILKRTKLNSCFFYLAAGLICFWPGLIVHSSRIGNDSLYYLFYALGLYFLISWYNTKGFNLKFIYLSVLFAVLAFFVKVNALILFTVIFILLLIKFLKSKEKKAFFLRSIPIAAAVLLALLLKFSPSVMSKIYGDKNDLFIRNSTGLVQANMVDNFAVNYLYFDIESFLIHPYMNPWNNSTGRQWLWNYILKTSVFGEFSFESLPAKNIAMVISFLLIIMTAVFLAGFFINDNLVDSVSFNLPHLLNIILSLLAVIALRIRIPAACGSDFRYILPVIISFTLFLMLFINNLKTAVLRYFISGLCALFIIMSALFFLFAR